MPVGAAAIPWIIGAGTAASGVGSVLSAKSGAAKNVSTTAPNALFPWLNQSYAGQMKTAGPEGIGNLQQMSKTGNPVDVGDAFSQMLNAQQKTLSMGRAGLREQFGSAGLAGSSSFRDAAVNYEGQASKDFMSTFANMQLQSNEGAAQRALSASGMLADQFQTGATAYTPSSTLVSGTPSAAGSGLTSMGNMLSLFGLLNKK